MSNAKNRLLAAAGALSIALGALLSAPIPATAGDKTDKALEEGKKLAFDRTKGNCLACHYIDGGTAAGNIGPPLIAMQVRFPDKEKLRAQIWDSTVANPETAMPPFGSHQILTDQEIDMLVDFIWTL